jgi:hypothetical protein
MSKATQTAKAAKLPTASPHNLFLVELLIIWGKPHQRMKGGDEMMKEKLFNLSNYPFILVALPISSLL